MSDSGELPMNTAWELIADVRGLAALASTIRTADIVALDLETAGPDTAPDLPGPSRSRAVRPEALDPLLGRPRLLQLGFASGYTAVVDLFQLPELGPVADALRNAVVLGHNLQFDLSFLAHHFDIRPRAAVDTMLASRVLDGGMPRERGYHSLAGVCQRWLGITLEKEEQTSDWSGALSDAQYSYAAHDAAVLHPLWACLAPAIRQAELTRVFDLECGVLPVIVDMGLAGVGIDTTLWEALLVRRTRAAVAERVGAVTGLGVDSPDSVSEVLSVLQGRGLAITSTSAEVLALHRGLPGVTELLEYRTSAAFVRGAGKRIGEAAGRHPDARIHASLKQLAAPTGRQSCSQPNLMGLDKKPGARECVVPAAGFLLIVADYATIELRVLAAHARDERLLAVFREGGDPHRATASLLLHKPPEDVTSDERSRAKAVNFGFAYGMGVTRFIAYALKNFRVTLTSSEAMRFREGYLRAYRGIARWQEREGRAMRSEVRTGSGRVRYFPHRSEGYSDRLNTPIQGTAADGLKAAMILLHRRLPAFGARLVLTVHDEVLVEAPEGVAEAVLSLVEACMIEGMEEFVKGVPIVVEAEVRTSWAKGSKVVPSDRGGDPSTGGGKP